MYERELDVLNVLFKGARPMTATEIIEEREERGLTQSTVTAVLRKLLNQGLVEVAGITYSGRVLARQFVPTEKAKEAVLKGFVDNYMLFKDVISLNELQKAIKEEMKKTK